MFPEVSHMAEQFTTVRTIVINLLIVHRSVFGFVVINDYVEGREAFTALRTRILVVDRSDVMKLMHLL